MLIKKYNRPKTPEMAAAAGEKASTKEV